MQKRDPEAMLGRAGRSPPPKNVIVQLISEYVEYKQGYNNVFREKLENIFS